MSQRQMKNGSRKLESAARLLRSAGVGVTFRYAGPARGIRNWFTDDVLAGCRSQINSRGMMQRYLALAPRRSSDPTIDRKLESL